MLKTDETLSKELKKYISLVKKSSLYALLKRKDKVYEIKKASQNEL